MSTPWHYWYRPRSSRSRLPARSRRGREDKGITKMNPSQSRYGLAKRLVELSQCNGVLAIHGLQEALLNAAEAIKAQHDADMVNAALSEKQTQISAGYQYAPILEEVMRAVAKFPTWPTDPLHALAVLGEEFGELTKEMLQLTYEPHKTSIDEV